MIGMITGLSDKDLTPTYSPIRRLADSTIGSGGLNFSVRSR